MSSLYESAPYGKEDQGYFYNMVAEVEVFMSPEELLKGLLDIEREMGRKREEKWGPRNIDLDILFYDDLVIESESLTVPHPDLENRVFILLPLFEIAPDFRHPVTGKSVARMLSELLKKKGIDILTIQSGASIMGSIT